MDLKLPESSGLIVKNIYAIQFDNPYHGGEMTVCVKNAQGVSAWGFGLSYQDAADDAVAAFNRDY